MFVAIRDDGVVVYAAKNADDDPFEDFIHKIIDDLATEHPERKWPEYNGANEVAKAILDEEQVNRPWKSDAEALIKGWDWLIVETTTWMGVDVEIDVEEPEAGILSFFGGENIRLNLSLPLYPFKS